LGIALGIILPVGGALLFLLVVALVIMMVYTRRKIRQRNEWEIDFNEIDMGEQIGVGAFGKVHKALWKGTEVAVKIMASETVSRDMERNFKDEVPPS
jgi:preprotein translocase subunit YajC